jgi:hypothetical protein
MAKQLPDATIDSELNYVGGCDTVCVCSGQPTTEAEAYTSLMLARTTLAGGDFTNTDDTSGRKVTVAAKPGVSITNPGTATHVALVNHAGGTIRLITTCNSLALVAGNLVDIPSFKFNAQDPT